MFRFCQFKAAGKCYQLAMFVKYLNWRRTNEIKPMRERCQSDSQVASVG